MSACRALDVLMGSGAHGARGALPAAAVVGAHIGVTTTVSRSEVQGASPRLPRAALAATAAVAGRRRPARRAPARSALGADRRRRPRRRVRRRVGRAHADAARDPSPERLQRAVGTGVLGLMPLEAGLLAGAGALVPAGGVAALWPLARSLARRRSVT